MRQRPDYWYRQSAVIPYRERSGALEVLMVTTRKKKRWIFPKGIREPDLSPGDSGAREALEEAGVTGRVSAEPLGRYVYRKWGGTCTVEVYALAVEQVLETWDESFRDRQWLSPDAAAARAREPELQALVLALPRSLGLQG